MPPKLNKKEQRIERKAKKAEAQLNIMNINKNDKKHKISFSSDDEAPHKKKKNDYTLDNCQDIKIEESQSEKLARLRAEIRERQKLSMTKPKIFLQVPEVNPYASSITDISSTTPEHLRWSEEEERNSSPLFVTDIQHAVSYAIQGNKTSFQPRWCKFLRWTKISKVTVVNVEKVGIKEYRTSPSLKFLKEFPMTAEFATPYQYDKSVEEELFRVAYSRTSLQKAKDLDLTANELSQKIHKKTSIKIKIENNKAKLKENGQFSRLDLLLSPEQLVSEGYPLPYFKSKLTPKSVMENLLVYMNFHYNLAVKTRNFVQSKDDYKPVTENSPMFAVDCEMVHSVRRQNELARISVVNEDLECIYETLVKPPTKVLNFLTPYSGITPKHLFNVETTLEDVQKHLRNILPADAIWCGQSLVSDLFALQMYHPYVIDTSCIFNLTGDRRMKSGLKRLAATFLNKTIQDQSEGHHPTEDAETTMELVKLKLKEGLNFGDVLRMREDMVAENALVREKSNGCIKNAFFQLPGVSLYESFFSLFKDMQKTAKLYERQSKESLMKQLKANLDNCELEFFPSDKVAVKSFISEANKDDFSWIRLQSYGNLTEGEKINDNEKEYLLKKTDDRIRKIIKSVPDKSLLVVLLNGNVDNDINNGLCLLKIIDRQVSK
ncbi:DgyrCDS10386 [Dimorphilus gyrociliatus]|uniref:DgyrCDS10386 n=1 Tax=Dimorphilus gyrociliatus TaxID=2664684 RepID=A0A7I8W085_9ANNE|nr:DgyrCDS10386 [Dimorphilus gyrociliatus]